MRRLLEVLEMGIASLLEALALARWRTWAFTSAKFEGKFCRHTQFRISAHDDFMNRRVFYHRTAFPAYIYHYPTRLSHTLGILSVMHIFSFHLYTVVTFNGLFVFFASAYIVCVSCMVNASIYQASFELRTSQDSTLDYFYYLRQGRNATHS